MPEIQKDWVGQIVIDVPVVSPTTPCEEVIGYFEEDPDLLVVTVLSNGHPIGLVHRVDFIQTFAAQYGYAIFSHKPITRLMNNAPLIVDASNNIDFLIDLLVRDATHDLLRGFIVCNGTQYLGVGTALSLLQVSSNRVIKRSEELLRAKNAAVEANKSKSTFLANMNHELRTPLNAIIGFTELIQQQIYGPIAQEQYGEYIDIINSSGHHLLKVINTILDMSKIESGSMEMREEICDACEIADYSLRIVKNMADKKNITLNTQINDGIPDIYADQSMVQQTLINLLSNAVKFSPDNSLIDINIFCASSGGVVMEVVDRGIGIPKDQIDKILVPFYQVDGVLSRSQEGTGLGLAIVKNFLELHKATLDIKSNEGKGTTISIHFPPDRTRDRITAELRKNSA